MLDFMDNINENIAENITKLRKRAGMTQSDLADKLNYSDKAISKWERGENVPSIEMLYEITKIFDVNIEIYYIEDEENNNSNLLKLNQMIFKNNNCIPEEKNLTESIG